MSSQSPTSRTLAYLKEQGIRAGVTERWNPYARIRQDLFGFIDLIALYPDGVCAIQVTSDGGVAARRKKILTECREAAEDWLSSGGLIEVWGWGKKGPRGAKKVWTPRVERISL